MAPKQRAGKPKNSRAQGGKQRARGQRKATSSEKKDSACPIVGIGGSAGGFEAMMSLLKALPPKTGMAFVVVQHLDPRHASRLPSLLGKMTTMPVIEVKKRTLAEPDHVYVQPPNKCVVIKDSALKLERRTGRVNIAIDQFFESLAEECGPLGIGVILSGAGSDGTAGLRAIKAAGGLTFAQDEETAKFRDMPQSAIRAGYVDAVLPPPKIAREIKRIAAHPYVCRAVASFRGEPPADAVYERADDLGRIFLSLKKQMGVDFSNYKIGTMNRRIQRRMALHTIRTLGQYARFLRDNKKEIEALFNDLLINVTRFFREPVLFRSLKKRFLPQLIKKKARGEVLRAWVPGCATGEEVYSLAICILETLGRRASDIRVQIFGTDLSETMIDHARAGTYPHAIEKDVSATRLKRFFEKSDSTYQISRHVREMCTFARQNVTTDPPFSRLDLISCRNVLIYLGPDLHKRCLPQFHHALNPGGYLILGPAESVGSFEGLFELVDKKNKIYVKKAVQKQYLGAADYPNFHRRPIGVKSVSDTSSTAAAQLQQMADRIMLGAYAPAAVVVDENLHIQQFRGRTDLYLEHAPGPATLNLLQLVRPSLAADLRTAIHRAIKQKKPVRKDRALVKIKDSTREVNLQIVPFRIAASDESWLLIIFDETTKGTKPGKSPSALGKTASQREIAELRRDLAASKESLQAIIEEQEATNEELKSANEEIESSNEELQSTNEELETAKEELQSTNEELTTLNEELSNRNFEMMQLNSDLNNLLASTQLPIVMVDNSLAVRRATPAAREAFNVLQSDIGRPLHELRPDVEISDLENILRKVMETLATHEERVKDNRGRSFWLRVRPYRTGENKIDGAVLTLLDIPENSTPSERTKKKDKAAK